MHHCFTDFILAHLEKSTYQVDLDDELCALSVEEREQLWQREYPHPCRTTCPAQPNIWREDDGISDDDDHEIMNSTPLDIAGRPPRTRASTRSLSSTLSPLFGTLDVGPLPMNLIQDPPSPTLATPGSSQLTRPTSDPVEQTNSDYQPLQAPPFINFQLFENEIMRTASIPEINEPFTITAGSVSAAAEGLVNAIRGIKQKQHASLVPYQIAPECSRDFCVIEPAGVTLSTMFSQGNWIFKASVGFFHSLSFRMLLIFFFFFDSSGHSDDDNVGSGVMRQILAQAIAICQNLDHDITEHLGNSDDYVVLKISADGIVQQDTLDLYYAFGVLCAIFLVKAHSAPEPVSPALIQAAIGGIDSILDPK